jgi:arylsulfatase A-like enzyme
MIPLPAMLAAGLLAAGCSSDPAPSVDPSSAEGAPPLLLARHPELLVSLELPPDSRDGVEVPERIPVRGPFELRRSTDGVHSFEASLPIRLRSLFFIRPPDGMTLHRAGEDEPITFRRGSRQSPRSETWSFAARTIQAHFEADRAPAQGELELVYGRASERERGLNLRWSGLEEKDFALRSAWQEHVDRHGVLLPAPGRASWSVTVPPEGRLAMELGLLEPEVSDLEPGDGAELVVEIAAAGQAPQRVESFALRPGDFEAVRVDLAAWAGQQVELTLRSDPGESGRYDYVFVGEPSLYTPLADPPRVVLVFIDTLRRDHLELYGYERATMPRLTAWSEQAVVFDAARTPAPWTLPSARALLLGGQPEFWGAQASLPERLGATGWSSAAFVGNVYLSANFEMADGWSHHFVENWPQAEQQVDRLESWLEVVDDRPALAMLHLMDTHLPYTEPRRYRKLFAGDTPEGLEGHFLRSDVTSATRGKGRKEARRYVVDRYDGAIRYVDDQVARVLEELGPQDVAVVFSDHGEEFWDHNGFEHGHTVYEELLAVPMVVRAPGLEPGRVDQVVSLIDLTPTLLELLGVSSDASITGRSLVPLTRGEPEAVAAFEERLHGFGRPLYGPEQWGVLDGQRKYATNEGKESLFDLGVDPVEQDDLARGAAAELPTWRETLGRSLDRSASLGFRLEPGRDSARATLEAVLTVPGGVRAAWVGADPTAHSAAAVCVEGERVRVHWEGGHAGTREVFVVPERDPVEVLPELLLEAQRGARGASVSWEEGTPVPEPDGRSRRLLDLREGKLRVTLGYAVAPQPPEDGRELGGYDSETAAALEALGYVEGAAPEEREAEHEDWMPVCAPSEEAAVVPDDGALPVEN